jgi:hypothetical protein
VAAEIDAALAFWKVPNDYVFSPRGKYFALLIVALPMVAGMNGYSSARRRLSSANHDVVSALSVQFLTLIMAYAAVLVCIEPLIRVLRAPLK